MSILVKIMLKSVFVNVLKHKKTRKKHVKRLMLFALGLFLAMFFF